MHMAFCTYTCANKNTCLAVADIATLRTVNDNTLIINSMLKKHAINSMLKSMLVGLKHAVL